MPDTPQWPVEPCRSCGRPVIWALTGRGRDMPVNAQPSDDGNILLRPGAAKPLADVLPVAKQFGLQGRLRRSHFADCPQAAGMKSTRIATPCPNDANHTPHPAGYIALADWADDALVVADNVYCEGCGQPVIWTPKRADLRIAVDWPPGTCDWGGCDEDAVAERFWPQVELATSGELRAGAWLPVCRTHTGLKPRRPLSERGQCSGCGKQYALSTAGLVRAHDHGWNRCVGSGRAPRPTGATS